MRSRSAEVCKNAIAAVVQLESAVETRDKLANLRPAGQDASVDHVSRLQLQRCSRAQRCATGKSVDGELGSDVSHIYVAQPNLPPTHQHIRCDNV